MRFRPSRAFVVSLALHAAGAFGLWMVAKSAVPVTQAPPPGLEFDYLAAPPPVAPPPPAPQPVEPVAAQEPPVPVRTRAPSTLARTAVRPTVTNSETGTVEPSHTEPSATIEPSTATPPAVAATTPAPGTPRILTASELYGSVDALAGAAAASGSIDLGRPGSGYRASRDLFGRPRVGSEIDRVRAVASAPTIAALAETNHMQPAGTMRHDRAASRRAEESFSPVREIPDIGLALLRAPMRMVPPTAHVQSDGESAIGAALDAAHSSSFTMAAVTPPMSTCPPYHILRADIEVDQDVGGAVLATRVVAPSRVAGFDEAAMRAIREALPEVATLNTGAGRRSRWSFEVSDAPSPVLAAMCGNEGWRVAGDQSNGVRVRMRVRMIGAMNLNRGS